MIKYIHISLLVSILFISCSNQKVNEINKDLSGLPILDEVEIFEIPLDGEIADRNSELSGLCWYGTKLLLLPQYPNRFSSSEGKIYFIEKEVLDKRINNIENEPIQPDYFAINLQNMEHLFSRGSGFEAVTIIADTAYFTIEHLNNGNTESILIMGIIDTADNSISLIKDSAIRDPNNLEIHNISDESILNYKNEIIPIYEIFGKNLNFEPKVSVFDNNLNYKSHISFPNIEYRITDVTAVDDSGYFWAINYFYPGDNNKLKPAEDEILRKYGAGKSHISADPLERIIKLRINKDNIELSDQNPIYLELLQNNSRNWEGIVKYENKGFLLVTDTYPRTILAFAEIKD